MKNVSMALVLVVSMGAGAAMAGDEHDHGAPVAGSAELERVKALAGRWEGTATHMGGSGPPNAGVDLTPERPG